MKMKIDNTDLIILFWAGRVSIEYTKLFDNYIDNKIISSICGILLSLVVWFIVCYIFKLIVKLIELLYNKVKKICQ